MYETKAELVLLGSAGSILLEGSRREFLQYAEALGGGNSALAVAAGIQSGSRVSRTDVMSQAEELGFVSRRGMPKGFLTSLPNGKFFEACVDGFNSAHLEALRVNPIEFPLVFDCGGAEMAELTEQYAEQDRMFALTGPGESLRLSYAADPNMFSWLQGQTFRAADLPYAMYSPQPVFRKFQSGELSIQRTRQFTVPDIHIWTTPEDGPERYLHALQLAGEAAGFWFGTDYVHMLDSVVGSRLDDIDFYVRAAKAAAGYTLVRRLPERPKYYAQKTAIVASSGYDNVLVYNLQYDDLNPRRFNIRTDGGEYATVIHACVAMAMSRMLPLVIGRALAGLAPKVIPAELAARQVVFVPIGPRHLDRARELAAELCARGIRAEVDEDFRRSLGARIARLRKAWQPLYAVVGDRELTASPQLSSDGALVEATYEDHLDTHISRWARCAPQTPMRASRPPLTGAL